jgi:uncharacterized protein
MKIFNISSWRIVASLVLLSLGNFGLFSNLQAQTSGSSGKSSNLYMQVRTTPEKKLLISWTPLDTFTFKQGFKQGYTLSRYDSATNKTTLLSDRILPKDTTAFINVIRQDTTFGNYYGMLMYWVHFANDSPNIQLRYNQIISEGHNNPQTAVLTGLGWIDTTTFTEGGRYRYDLKLNGGGSLATQAGWQYPEDEFSMNGATFPNLDFGDTEPLASFLPRNKPIQIYAVAKAFGDSIYLRWSPDSYGGWIKGNKYGYRVIRREVTEKGLSETSIRIDSIRPFPLGAFAEQPMRSDTGCIIAAQTLYGENMKVSGDASLMDKQTQSEMRFTVAMQAADKSFLAAFTLGLARADYNVKKGKKYQYTVIPLAGGMPATILVDNNVTTPVKPQDFQAKQGDHWIQLSWSFENRKTFTSYRVYRSEDDGKTYNLITPSPLVFLLQGNEPDTFRYTFSDSIPTNYKRYKYRLSALDLFAEWSPFAELETFGRDLTPPRPPHITEGGATPNSFNISWELDSMDTDMAGFQVFIGNSTEGDFKPITKLLPKEQRQYTHRDSVNLTRSYYFRVVSIDTAGNAAYSGPYYVVVIDSIPPLTPKLVRGKVGKTGIARIVWQHGTESDLAGYRVYSSTNNRDFTLITAAPIDSNAFHDTLALNTLNIKMYYKVLAEDQNGNKSPYSETITLQKPDTITPVMPVMTQSESGGKGVTLKWTPSTSTDVMAHLLYRKADKDTTAKWALIQTLNAQAEWHMDTTAFIEKTYLYYMVAQDSAENVSEPSLTVSGRRFFDGKSGGIQTLQAAFNKEQKAIQVSWQTAPVTDPFLKDKGYFIFIYRAKQNEPLEKYQQVAGKDAPSFVDDEVAKGQYRYALCMAYDDGKITPLTQEVIVDIE